MILLNLFQVNIKGDIVYYLIGDNKLIKVSIYDINNIINTYNMPHDKNE